MAGRDYIAPNNRYPFLMAALYPLRFDPLLKRYLWGGRRLGTELGKPIDFGTDYAESWDVADHGSDQTHVSNGPLRGTSLAELVRLHGPELFGQHWPQRRFPLLFKYLDCHRVLSLQVHPDDEAAARLDPPDLGKTEAWLILDALPGAVVYAGLKQGLNRQSFERAVRDGRIEECMNRFEPKAGDCIFLPAGAVHALGAGLLVAEVQQASNTTYRLHDWNRVGPDGKPRDLHIDKALAVINYLYCDVRPQISQATERPFVERLAACDKFVLDRWSLHDQQAVGGDDRFHLLSVIEGELSITAHESGMPGDDVSTLTLMRGDSLLLPASLPAVQVAPHASCIFVDIYLP